MLPTLLFPAKGYFQPIPATSCKKRETPFAASLSFPLLSPSAYALPVLRNSLLEVGDMLCHHYVKKNLCNTRLYSYKKCIFADVFKQDKI